MGRPSAADGAGPAALAGRDPPHAADLASGRSRPGPSAAPVLAVGAGEGAGMRAVSRWERIPLDRYLEALPIRRRRLRFRTDGELRLPAFSGALWHAVLGPALKAEVCTVPPGVCDGCARSSECAYPRLFESRAPSSSRAPLADVARIPGPFVLHTAPWLDRRLAPGEDFELGLAVADREGDLVAVLMRAFAAAVRRGLGRRRVTARLEGWTDEPWVLPTTGQVTDGVPDAVLRLRMLTPLRLKHRGRYLRDFGAVALARDLALRVAALGHYHGGLPWPAPWPEVVAEAAALTVRRRRLRWVEASRFSRRQERMIVLGGLVGDVELRGVRADFRRLLAAGAALHAGKGSSLGLGQLALETATDDGEDNA